MLTALVSIKITAWHVNGVQSAPVTTKYRQYTLDRLSPHRAPQVLNE